MALPVDWLPGETDRALLIINKIANFVLTGEQDTLKGALAVAQDKQRNHTTQNRLERCCGGTSVVNATGSQ